MMTPSAGIVFVVWIEMYEIVFTGEFTVELEF